MIQNVKGKIAENLNFVKKQEPFRGSTEGAVHNCSSVNSQENIHDGQSSNTAKFQDLSL